MSVSGKEVGAELAFEGEAGFAWVISRERAVHEPCLAEDST